MCNRGTLKRSQGSWKKAWTLTSTIQIQEVSKYLLKKKKYMPCLTYSKNLFPTLIYNLFFFTFCLSHQTGMLGLSEISLLLVKDGAINLPMCMQNVCAAIKVPLLGDMSPGKGLWSMGCMRIVWLNNNKTQALRQGYNLFSQTQLSECIVTENVNWRVSAIMYKLFAIKYLHLQTFSICFLLVFVMLGFLQSVH